MQRRLERQYEIPNDEVRRGVLPLPLRVPRRRFDDDVAERDQPSELVLGAASIKPRTNALLEPADRVVGEFDLEKAHAPRVALRHQT